MAAICSARARILTRKAPVRWFHDGNSAPAQDLYVVLRRWVIPHFGVHGGRHDDGTRCHQHGRGQEIIGASRSQTGNKVSRGRGDDHRIGLLAYRYMLHVLYGLKNTGGNGISG